MKKSSVDSIHSNYYKEFNRMEICHHCKLLHHEDNLITCEYHSSKYGHPIPPSPYYDSYVYQILKSKQIDMKMSNRGFRQSGSSIVQRLEGIPTFTTTRRVLITFIQMISMFAAGNIANIALKTMMMARKSPTVCAHTAEASATVLDAREMI
jgi:hypothetical protein